MLQYIGTKIISATPMTESEFAVHQKKQDAPKVNRDGYLVRYEDGYESWSPKDVFEKAYRLSGEMNFGLALEAIRIGKRVCRSGWNGKGMWLALVKETRYQVDGLNLPLNSHEPSGNVQNLLPWIGMFTADKKFVPWLASQTDMLADDWMIVE